MWRNKKIRDKCRKNLADWRLRVKGRLVKRDILPRPDDETTATTILVGDDDEDMPDVNDPEAGFCPTED